MKKLRVAIQMDPLERLHQETDSTLYLARAALMRGYELFHYLPGALRMEVGRRVSVTTRGHTLKFRNGAWTLGKESLRNLADFDVILMRQDPPFDLAYITATHILDHLQGRVKIVNDPTAVRNAPEKLLATHFPHLMPPTLVTRDIAAIEKFRARHGAIVFKPLYGWAGYGIFQLTADDPNLHALLETMGAISPEPWMIQKYLPAIKTAGDKRIILLDGEPVGVYRRIPAKGDTRGNMRVGAKAERAPLTRRDREICKTLGPVLRASGLVLAGIDVIGDYLTEINVTSPTGLPSADRFAGRTFKNGIAKLFWDRLAK